MQCEAAARGLVKCRHCGVNGADNCALGTRTTLAGSGAEIARRARWRPDVQAMFKDCSKMSLLMSPYKCEYFAATQLNRMVRF